MAGAKATSGSSGTLAGAIAGADKRVTVLDDRVDAEEHAAWLWLKAHKLQVPHKRIVIGTETLPNPWDAKTKTFVDVQSAQTYVSQFAHNKSAMRSLQLLIHSLDKTPPPHPLHDDEVLAAVAAALAAGKAWVIELPPSEPQSRFIGVVDASVSPKVNGTLGTKVDFDYICKIEGGQWLRGYIPFSGGKVAGRSGMTIGSGFDVGQWNEDDLKKLGLPADVLKQILPFADTNFKGKTKAQVAAEVGKTGPVPQFAKKPDVDASDALVFGAMLGRAIKQWDPLRKPGVPAFKDLPGNWQTVWLSRVYQEGPYASTTFRQLARAGQWQQAADALGSQTSYVDRVKTEAAMLNAQLPPPIAPPAAKPSAKPAK